MTNLTEDVLQPELKSSEEEAVTFDGGQTELTEVETSQVERASTDEQVTCLCTVHATSAVETAQSHAVQLNIPHGNTVCR